MAAVEPLSKAAFELFDKDRDVVHAPAIGFQEALDLIESIWLLAPSSHLLFEGLTTRRTESGFDALK
jgi:hypothetical protein